MRRVWFVAWIVTASCLVPTVLADDAPVRLELESSLRTLRLGQQTELHLRILGPSVHAIVAGTEGVSPSAIKPAGFVYTLDFKPTHEGEYTFGPYSLTFNGHNLTSNMTKIHVLPGWDGQYGVRYRVDRTTIVLGEDFELVYEIWEKTNEHKSLSLKQGEAFTVSERPSLFSISTSEGQNVYYMMRSWLITPKNPGQFKVTKDVFKELPTGIEPPNLVVEVQ